MTVSLLNWGVHVWRPSHILRPTPTTVEPLRVSPPEAVACQFELNGKCAMKNTDVFEHEDNMVLHPAVARIAMESKKPSG